MNIDEQAGSDKQVRELTVEHAQTVTPSAKEGTKNADAQRDGVAEFEAALPEVNGLIEAIIADVNAEVRELVTADPAGAAQIGAEELARWIADDLATTLREISDLGWTA
jgi:hypothetical protein